MPVFEYKALAKSGRQLKGVIDAENERSARTKLKQQGIFPTAMEEGQTKDASKEGSTVFDLKNRRVNPAMLWLATRQLATLVAAGMPLVESIRALGDQLDQSRLKRVFAGVCDRVNEGSTMADAMREYPKVFPRLYVNMIASGEVSGSLDVVLERLADLLESQAALRRKVLSALTYPILMLCLCFGVIVLLLAYVVPEITKIFKDQNQTLPLPTQIVIVLSDFMKGYWWLLLGVLVFIILSVERYSKTPNGRRRIDTLKLRLPIFGPIALKVATSRFSRNLGTLLSSGVELLTALGIVKNIIGNVVLEEIVDSAIVGVREGRSLASELSAGGRYPRMLVHMIAIGEQTGQLEQMLGRAATNYESEVNATISGLTSILEPLLIIFLAVVVGCILASVMLPMLEMNSLGQT